jgi:hypothetical protein
MAEIAASGNSGYGNAAARQPPRRRKDVGGVRNLIVEAPSLMRAREIEAALKEFERELLADDGHYVVHITVPGDERGIVDVLNALAPSVRERGSGAARLKLELDGQSYVLDAPA